VALTRAPENVGENHDISFEAPLTLRLTGVGGRGAGGESTSPKLLIWWKSGKICGNLCKMCDYLRKIAVYVL